MSKSDNINELAGALAKAQGTIKDAVKDSKNPFFKSTYADLSSVWAACRKPLSDNGLAVTQMLDDTDHGLMMTTMLMHASGQWVASTLAVNPVKNDPQGIGSAITYMRRYSIAALVGVAPSEDDDGNASSQPPAQRPHLPANDTAQDAPAPQMPVSDAIPQTSGNGNGASKLDAARERVAKHARALNELSVQARKAGDLQTAEDMDALLRKVKRFPSTGTISDMHKLADELKAAEQAHVEQMQAAIATPVEPAEMPF